MFTHSLGFLIVELQQLKAAVFFQGSVKIPHGIVHFGNHRVVSEALTAEKINHIKCGDDKVPV